MSYYFSNSTKGFYLTEVHGSDMPSDIIEVTKALRDSLLDQEKQGKEITVVSGEVVAVDRQITWNWEEVREAQASKIEEVRWMVERHLTQRENTALTEEGWDHTPAEYQSLLQYMQTIREVDTLSTPNAAMDALAALTPPITGGS